MTNANGHFLTSHRTRIDNAYKVKVCILSSYVEALVPILCLFTILKLLDLDEFMRGGYL